MLPSLYTITDNMIALMESEEATDEQITATFGDLTEKSNHVCHFMADLKGTIDAFKAEEKRIAERRKAMENKHDRLRTYIRDNMWKLGIDKLQAGTFTITLRPSAGALEVFDASQLPPEYTIVEVKPDTAKIKAALKDGADIPGAHLVDGSTLTIR